MFRTCGNKGVIDEVLFEMHAGKFDYRLHADWVIRSADVNKRPFLCELAGHPSIEDDFRIRYPNTVRTGVERKFFSADFCGIGHLFSFRHAGAGGKGDGRMRSNRDGDGKFFAFGKCCLQEFVGVSSLNDSAD